MERSAAGATLDRQGVAVLSRALTAALLPTDPGVLAELVTALEELMASASAVQVRASVGLADALIERRSDEGVPTARLRVGVASAVAFARRESPHSGDRWLGFARALASEMPCTLALLEQGVLSEYRATLLVRETACLSVEHWRAVDAELCADAERLATWGNRQLAAEARRVAYRLDPRAVVARHERAVGERGVSLRPAPDSMTYLTALLPLAQGVACLAALGSAADTARAVGEPRSRGQVMDNTLVERLTGQASAADVAVGVHLVMTDAALLQGDPEPALIPGVGPVPAGVARSLVAHAVDADAAAWVRRLYRAPGTGELVALESRSRRFPAGLASLIAARDQGCRTPWCDAPIRHIDHVLPHQAGGVTAYANGQGLCEACNYAKQGMGWETLPRPGPGAPIEITTPAGQSRVTHAPDPPGGRLAAPTIRVDLFWPRAA